MTDPTDNIDVLFAAVREAVRVGLLPAEAHPPAYLKAVEQVRAVVRAAFAEANRRGRPRGEVREVDAPGHQGPSHEELRRRWKEKFGKEYSEMIRDPEDSVRPPGPGGGPGEGGAVR